MNVMHYCIMHCITIWAVKIWKYAYALCRLCKRSCFQMIWLSIALNQITKWRVVLLCFVLWNQASFDIHMHLKSVIISLVIFLIYHWLGSWHIYPTEQKHFTSNSWVLLASWSFTEAVRSVEVKRFITEASQHFLDFLKSSLSDLIAWTETTLYDQIHIHIQHPSKAFSLYC